MSKFFSALNVPLKETYTGKYNNAAVIVLTNHSNTERMLVIREKKKQQFNIPGGQREKGETDSWLTATREMREETANGKTSGFTLKNCKYHGLFVSNHNDGTCTVIHVCETTDNIHTGEIDNRETDFVGLLRVDHLLDRISKATRHGDIVVDCMRNKHSLRGCFKNTIEKMLL